MMEARIDVIRFNNEDVIATSGFIGTVGTFYIPTSDYSGAGSFSGNYVEFSGTIGGYDSGAGGYSIYDTYGAKDGVDGDRSIMIAAGSSTGPFVVLPDTGVPVPVSVMEGMSKNIYDAYSFGGGYYTNGQSYYELYF